jgi:hypothetical protein
MSEPTTGAHPSAPTLLGREVERHAASPLDRRRRRRDLGLVVAAIGLLVGAAVLVKKLVTRRRHERERFLARAGRLRQALRRAVANPEAVAAQQSEGVGKKVLAAALSAGAATATRFFVTRVVRPIQSQR